MTIMAVSTRIRRQKKKTEDTSFGRSIAHVAEPIRQTDFFRNWYNCSGITFVSLVIFTVFLRNTVAVHSSTSRAEESFLSSASFPVYQFLSKLKKKHTK